MIDAKITGVSLASGQGWDEVDACVREWVSGVPDAVRQVLFSPATGVYLHGSLAMGDYHRATSDVDLLVVVPHPLTPGERRSVGHALARHAEQRPTPGSLEVSVLTAAQAAARHYPVGFEVHYSDEWHTQVLTDQIDWGTERTDEDLPAHLHVARTRGITLDGADRCAALGTVPGQRFVAAVLDDLDWLAERIDQNPTYAVLNSCRVLELAAQPDALNDPQVRSKGEAARWAVDALGSRFARVVEHAQHSRVTGEVSMDQAAMDQREVHDLVSLAHQRSAGLR